MVGAVQDITERKIAEETLKKKNEELTRFIYTVSHDLKSPLVTIKSFSNYLQEDIRNLDQEAQDRDLNFIRNAADKMARLLDELLELSRIGRKEKPKVLIPLEEVVKSATDLVAGRLEEKKIKVKMTGMPVLLYGHAQRFIQLYQNLIDNAAKFMGEQQDPFIEVGTIRGENNEVVLFVRDNGKGIDPRYHHKIFGLFEKMDVETEGTGIGLALVKRIVEVHGGSVWFTSEGNGKGTTFYFTLEGTTKNK
jgi:signal transduction histidine kinase